ncbi:MAG: TonB-dependent receptor [Campylobacterales bacterium]
MKPLHTYPIVAVMAATALWADPVNIEHIVVSAHAPGSGLYLADTNGSQQRFERKSIAVLSTQANMNPFSVIQFSPSVNYTPADTAGSNEPSYHDPIRIRGKSQSGPGGVFMIDGMPISGNPGGGKQMMDMENVASIDLLKGYLTPEKNIGFSSLIGKVDMNVNAPRRTMNTTLSQSFGSYNFRRSFGRFDSGEMGDVRLFGSLSYLSNDKYKGEGDLTRFNGMVGLAYAPSDAFDAEVYLIHNQDDHHNYYALSYAEVRDLDTFYDKDFATTRPTADNDVNYYDWNKQSFDTTAVLSTLTFRPTSSDAITLKPYYKTDKGEYWNASVNANPAKNRVINWQIDHDLYGAVADYKHAFSKALNTTLGYWYHKQQPPGPPTDRRKYKVVGGDLVFDGYVALAETSYHTLQAPFAEVSGTFDAFDYSVGLQYQSFEISELKSYTFGTDANTSRDYDTAIDEGTLDPWASVKAKTFYTWIPSAYLGYRFNETDTLYASYSRTYGFDVNLFPTYMKNRANFVAKNVTLQQLWNKLELETSDNIDLGYKTMVGGVMLNPVVFVSFVKNKQANIYDPEYGVNYPANVGDAMGYGAEFSASGPLNESLEFLLGLSYNKFAFTQDFKSSPTTTIDTDGKQVPDAPEYMGKAALSYSAGGWTITPSVRYTSKRYGDLQNEQTIDAFTLFDLDVSYRINGFLGARNAVFRLSGTNLTDEKYISTIIAADNVLAASGTSSSYQTGTPLSVFGSLTVNF